jgi:hypothetical protein
LSPIQTAHKFMLLKLHNGNKSSCDLIVPMDEQMKRRLHNDIGIPLYGMGVGGKQKVDGRIDVDGENPLEFL